MAVLSRDTIAITGDFGAARKRTVLSRWISKNGGALSSTIHENVTHLIASKEHWKACSGLVPDALKYPHIKIVNLDWLETSLIFKQHHEAEFLWTNIEIERRQKKKEKQMYVKEVLSAEDNAKDEVAKSERAINKPVTVKKPTKAMTNPTERAFRIGHEAAKRDLFSDTHHIYRDSTTFHYNLRLSRPNFQTNSHEALTLTLYESALAPPYLYATVLIYHGAGSNHLYADRVTGSLTHSKTYVLAPLGSDYERAFRAFRAAFHVFVGVDWRLRLWAGMPQGLSAQASRAQRRFITEQGLVGPQDEKDEGMIASQGLAKRGKFFCYKLPDWGMGEAVGEAAMMKCYVQRFGKPPVLGPLERERGGFFVGGHEIVAGSGMEEREE